MNATIVQSPRAAVFMLAAVAVSLLVPFGANAQVDEIIVTARKKEESLQDVPLSVTALSATDIARKGVAGISDVAKLNSSIQFDESFAQSDTRIVIRGLSPTRGRQNTAVLVDGIDLSSEAVQSSGGSLLINTRLIDLERIEAIAGPQMALYGRAAFNGAIQYVTKDPSEVFEAEVKVDGSSDSRFNANAAVSGPVLGELLGVRLNATWWDEEGFYQNSLTKDDIGSNEGYGFALTTRSDIGDKLWFKFRAEYTSDEGKPSPQAFLPFNAALPVPDTATASGANLAQCEENIPFIDALGTIPGNDVGLLRQRKRIMSPELFNTVTGGQNWTDDAIARQIVSDNPWISPHCEARVLSFTGEVPPGDELMVRLGTNPNTPGLDYMGYERDFIRFALNGNLELDKGTFTIWAGWLRSENVEEQDTNAFGVFDGSSEFLDRNVNSFSFFTDKVTEQTTLQGRFASNLDGPAQVTVGGVWWEEDVASPSRSITAQGSGTHCLWDSISGTLNVVGAADGCTGYTETAIQPYQQFAFPFRPAAPVDRLTDHWSIYGMVDIEMAENWTVTFEGRYNRETTDVNGPIPYDPFASGGSGGLNPCGIFFRECLPIEEWRDAGRFFDDLFFPWTDDLDPTGFVLDPAVIDAIPDACFEQDADAVMRSINEGPALIEREADGTPLLDPALGGQPKLLLDENGRAIPNPNNTDYFNPWCVGSEQFVDSWFSPKITIDWAPTDDMLWYFSWADARKPGGLSTLTIGSSFLNREIAEFKPEKMEVWELGANTQWLDRTLTVNGSLFFQDYTDKQALTSVLNAAGDRLISRIVNAGGAEAWGAEVQINWQPAGEFLWGSWALTGAYTWLDTEYTDFVLGTTSANTTAIAPDQTGSASFDDPLAPNGTRGNCVPDFSAGFNRCLVSYTGNELEGSAPGAFVGGIQYITQVTGNLDFLIETDVQWTDERWIDINNKSKVDEYWNIDLRIGLQSENWEVVAYANNLLDDDTVRFAGGGPGLGCCFILGSGIDVPSEEIPTDVVMVDLPLFNTGFLPPPRVVGVRGTFRFGGD